MYDAAAGLLHIHDLDVAESKRIDAVRPSTRNELYKRLHVARDYIAACYDQPITLRHIAAAACLSPNHLLRTFRSVFHQSPHKYLTKRRIVKAQQLLASTELPINIICEKVGYQSSGSFSNLFHRVTGLPPTDYRNRKR